MTKRSFDPVPVVVTGLALLFAGGVSVYVYLVPEQPGLEWVLPLLSSKFAETLFKILPLVVIVASARWVYVDANRQLAAGADVIPGLWCALTVLSVPIFLPAYLLTRATRFRSEIEAHRRSNE